MSYTFYIFISVKCALLVVVRRSGVVTLDEDRLGLVRRGCSCVFAQCHVNLCLLNVMSPLSVEYYH